MASNLHTYTATAADHDVILELTNEAFMADAFFKKKEYHLRFDRPSVESMMAAENSRFILAAETRDGVEVPCGSIFLHWEVSRNDNETLVRPNSPSLVHCICNVYVHPSIGNGEVLCGLCTYTL